MPSLCAVGLKYLGYVGILLVVKPKPPSYPSRVFFFNQVVVVKGFNKNIKQRQNCFHYLTCGMTTSSDWTKNLRSWFCIVMCLFEITMTLFTYAVASCCEAIQESNSLS